MHTKLKAFHFGQDCCTDYVRRVRNLKSKALKSEQKHLPSRIKQIYNAEEQTVAQ